MTLTRSFLLARWAQPLTDLAVNVGLGAVVPDPSLSWARADGWQCLAPEGWFWFQQLVPPVEAVEAEVGGPALGFGVEAGEHVRIAFRHDGEIRLVAFGASSTASAEYWDDLMVQQWGEGWRVEAARALCAWAASVRSTPVHLLSVCGVLWVSHRFREQVVVDLLEVLGLGPDPSVPPWWEIEVPSALYAVRARNLWLDGLVPPHGAAAEEDLAVVFVDGGVGLLDLGTRSWLLEPSAQYGPVHRRLLTELADRGWEPGADEPPSTADGRSGSGVEPAPLAGPRPWGSPAARGAALPDGAPGARATRVTIDPDVFGPPTEGGWDGWDQSPGFRVRSADMPGAVAALRRAGTRFFRVDEQGTELSEAELADTDLYTPNWVSDVMVYDVGAELVVDTKGELPGPMGRAMLRILVEELDVGGVAAHVAGPADEATLLERVEL
ncbi:hypothetical protein [Cellulomonas cellasea]|uniref:Uncharacterized protein n=2 Tax=Cellulomonas cellasea TaxID=43670 RepID=A0A0A0BDZ2_9CELL|nr:hypothetical protein [Cellulomonas cellasea]KGM03531.1 hypothetical protein Q760_02495 [Cellulomonas cellasea DSM 20118]GEA87139.1 hypothetical protein CCE01nite_10880 [Cellulomonas cellasea]